MAFSEYLSDAGWFIGLFALLALYIVAMVKNEKLKQLKASVVKLEKSLEEMDEQAKLIVRTDIELNKAQEELDKKLTALYSLQNLSRAISTTLVEEQIFKMVSSSQLEELGFEKAVIFLFEEARQAFQMQLNTGYSEKQTELISEFFNLERKFSLDLINNSKTNSSSTAFNEKFKQRIKTVFTVSSFVISPILPKEGSKGIFFVGTEKEDFSVTEGDEELITVVSNELGQALDNARLFEKTWKAQQELEKKVEERTRELTLALEEVQRVSKRKSDFISSVSHELRTPLTSIKGYASILLEEKLGQLPTPVKERLERVNRHSNELVNMINDLLDIARIESGKITMTLEKKEIKDIIASAMDLLAIQCKNKNIELAQEVQENLPAVSVDRSQIERVLINLLGNAVKFTAENGKITLRAALKDSSIQLDIQDTGIGIPPESMPMLFDEFYRVDNEVNQQVKGTGLGLSLVKHIIEAHGGSIWVNSKAGQGSTFSFTLPVE